MKRKTLISLIVFISVVLFDRSFASTKATQMISVGGGCFGAMNAANADVLYLLPEGILPLSDLYLKAGISLADSRNLAPSKDWLRFAVLYVDGMFYLTDHLYIGGGINYPLKVSDDRMGSLGGEAYIGTSFQFYERNNMFIEGGYSVVSSVGSDPFEGLDLLAGWRFDLTPVSEEKGIGPAPIEPVVAAPSTPEPVAVVPTKESISAAENEKLREELIKVQDYIQLLDKKILDAVKNNNAAKVLELTQLKDDALWRGASIKKQMNQ